MSITCLVFTTASMCRNQVVMFNKVHLLLYIPWEWNADRVIKVNYGIISQKYRQVTFNTLLLNQSGSLNIPIWVLYEIISKVHLSFNAKWKGTSQKYSLLMNKDFNVGLLLFKCCMYLLSHLLPFNFVIYFKLIFITLSWLRDRQYILNSMDKILIS